MGQVFLHPVDVSPCPVLTATVSQLFQSRDRIRICGPSPDITTVSIGSLVTELNVCKLDVILTVHRR